MKNKWLFLGLVVLLGAGCGETYNVSDIESDKSIGEDCEKAEVPFACWLDKAMSANDPNICVATGQGKWMNCISAYEEIKEVKVACDDLKDGIFQADCKTRRVETGASTSNQ